MMTTNFINREWYSVKGKNTVMGQSASRPDGWLEIKQDWTDIRRLIHVDDVENEIAFETKQLVSRQQTIEIIDGDMKKEEEKQVIYNNVDGFCDDMTSMRAGKVLRILNKIVSLNNIIGTRKERIKQLISEGYLVVDETRQQYTTIDGVITRLPDIKTGRKFFQHDSGYFFEEKQITSTGMKYAECLLKKG